MITTLPVAHISPDPTQPRREFDRDALTELAASITDLGQLQPIIVRTDPQSDLDGVDRHIIIAGERRWRAHQIAGLETIDAIVRDDVTGAELAALQIVENLQRTNLTTAELVTGIAALTELPGADGQPLGVGGVATRLGKSKAWVSRRAKVAGVHESIMALVQDGTLTDVDAIVDLNTLLTEFPKQAEHAIAVATDKPHGFDYMAPDDLRRESIRESLRACRERRERLAAEQAEAKARKESMTDKQRTADKEADAERKARDKRGREWKTNLPALREACEQYTEELGAFLQTATGLDSEHIVIRMPYLVDDYIEDFSTPERAKYQVYLTAPLAYTAEVQRRDAAKLGFDGARTMVIGDDDTVALLDKPAHQVIAFELRVWQQTGLQIRSLASRWPHMDNLPPLPAAPTSAPVIRDAGPGRVLMTLPDAIDAFIDRTCVIGGDQRMRLSVAYESWLDWCARAGERACDVADFATAMCAADAAITKRRRKDGYYLLGAAVADQQCKAAA